MLLILTSQLEKSAGHTEYNVSCDCGSDWRENEEDKVFPVPTLWLATLVPHRVVAVCAKGSHAAQCF